MLNVKSKKDIIPFLIAISILLIPVLVEAGGGHNKGGSSLYNIASYGMYDSGCCGGSSYNYLYPSYYQSNGRTLSGLGNYPSYSYYPTRSNSILPSYSSYPLMSNYNQLYSLGNSGLNYGFNYGLNSIYPWGQSQVTSKDYTVEQSRTTYLPGGSITNTVSESTEITLFPQLGSYMNYLNPYNTFGNWEGL